MGLPRLPGSPIGEPNEVTSHGEVQPALCRDSVRGWTCWIRSSARGIWWPELTKRLSGRHGAGGVPMGTAPAQQVRWNSERGTEAFGTDAHRRAARERGDA